MEVINSFALTYIRVDWIAKQNKNAFYRWPCDFRVYRTHFVSRAIVKVSGKGKGETGVSASN